MANLRTDSPISRRIVLAFLDFLNSVEPAPGIDVEGLEVVRECLEEVFKLDPSSVDVRTRPHLLVDLFSSSNADEQHNVQPDSCHATMPVEAPSTSSVQNVNEEPVRDPHASGVSQDELFGQFCGALEKIHFFKAMASGDDDHVQLDKAKRLFDEALLEMEKSGCQKVNSNNLAEALKSLGNQAMKSKLYSDAIELYTCAIALCEKNAVYYCNRAAAYTQLQNYTEAIADCNRSIEIDPNYSKAYSRLGFAYYEQGEYSDAISKGFLKALRLDPNSSSIRENIRAAEQKLREELQRTDQDQNARRTNGQDSNGQSAAAGSNRGGPTFTSMPFSGSLPDDFGTIFMDVGPEGSDSNGSNEPGITLGGSVSFTVRAGETTTVELPIGQQMQDIMGAMRSVMDMFPSPPPGPQGDGQA
ncbi:hypothetical protein AAC387_Pa07g2907 [Persea americana]